MRRIYLDNAATTAIDQRVIDAMVEVMSNTSGNPSSIHNEGRKAKTLVENARKSIANLLSVSPGEILFTSGGTEADNMAIRCAIDDYSVKHLITSPIEHHAVLHTAHLCQKQGINVHLVNITEQGHVDMEHLKELFALTRGEKTLVSLMHANNEIGNLLDIEAVGNICKEYKALFHCDMVQTVGHLPINLKQCGVHFTAASAHKFNGPKGVGFIYISDEVKITPMIFGGAQERNMRGGTENIYGIVGLAKALEIAYDEMEEQSTRILDLKNYMIDRLNAEIPNVSYNGDHIGESLYTVLNVSFPPNDVAEMMLFYLDIEGIAASGGSACTSGSDLGSHVLAELPVKEGHSAVRFSFGKYNTAEDVDLAVFKIKEILKLIPA